MTSIPLSVCSWNVNGIRAAVKKGFYEFLQKKRPDILCVQEIKIHDQARANVVFDFSGYTEYWNPAEKPGYSGTAIFLRDDSRLHKRLVSYVSGMQQSLFDSEGRVQTMEFDTFYLLNTYFPHTRHDLSRLKFKLEFNNALLAYAKTLEKKKPLVIAGDFNVAHKAIDLARPKDNQENPGFLPDERAWMTAFLDAGFIDTYRFLHPAENQYTWWSFRFRARERNIGWRIDYICISDVLKKHIKDASIWDTVTGADHCPINVHISI